MQKKSYFNKSGFESIDSLSIPEPPKFLNTQNTKPTLNVTENQNTKPNFNVTENRNTKPTFNVTENRNTSNRFPNPEPTNNSGNQVNFNGYRPQGEVFTAKCSVAASMQAYGSSSVGQSYIAPAASKLKNVQEEPIATLKASLIAEIDQDVLVANKSIKAKEKNLMINLLTRRNSSQREALVSVYGQVFNKNLIDQVKSTFSNTLRDVFVSLLYFGSKQDAYFINNSYESKDKNSMTEILCTRSTEQIESIKDSYIQTFEKGLNLAISTSTTGTFQKLLLSLINNPRDSSLTVDQNLASKDAVFMSENVKKPKPGFDNFVAIFTERNYSQLEYTLILFKQYYGVEFEKALKKSAKSSYEYALKSISRFVSNPLGYYANQLRKGIQKVNTTQIIRVIVTRCEFDLGNIIKYYDKKYKSLFEVDLTKALKTSHGDLLTVLKVLSGKS